MSGRPRPSYRAGYAGHDFFGHSRLYLDGQVFARPDSCEARAVRRLNAQEAKMPDPRHRRTWSVYEIPPRGQGDPRPYAAAAPQEAPRG